MRRAGGRGAGRWVRIGLAGLLLWGSAAAMAAVTGPAAGAATTDGTVTVSVLRDFFGTGIINATMDVPQQGMIVAVTDPAGARVQGVTDATGKVVVAPSATLAGGQYRVDVSIPQQLADHLGPAPAAAAATPPATHFDSFVSYVDVRNGANATVTTGVWNPADYAETASPYYIPVQTPPVKADGTANDPNSAALVSFPPDARGACTATAPGTCGTTLNTQAQVGTTWGLAYDRYRSRIFQAAFARRFTRFGPGGGGAIYSQPIGGGAPAVFAVVPGTTLTPHNPLESPIKDSAYVDVPGKEGLGGIAMTENGQSLYAVNLLTRTLVQFAATGPVGVPTAVTPIPDPGCASPTDWRPFAVNAHDNKLYVGGVCSAESTGNRADLKAVVYTVNGATFTPVLTKTLDFHRGQALKGVPNPVNTDYWNPWDTRLANWDSRNAGGFFINPQPELASLAFARDGSMILGFRDRFMDSAGSGGLDPRPGNDTAESGVSGGDVNQACATPAGGFEWEGTGNCPNHATPANDGNEPADVVEYYPGDFYAPDSHQEAAQGSVAYKPQQQKVISTELDPVTNVNTSGAGFYDVATGAGPGNAKPDNGYEITVTPQTPDLSGFAKAGGLGDVAFAAANAPIQIGNYVWFDGDHNGVQDPHRTDEVALQGATVNLLDATGAQVATATTTAAGEYYFGGVGAAYQLTPGARYTIQFDVCTASTANVPGTPAAVDLRFTLPTVGTDRVHDSNVVPPTTGQLCNGTAPAVAPAQAGGVDHTFDAGVYIPQPVVPTTPPTTTPVSPGGGTGGSYPGGSYPGGSYPSGDTSGGDTGGVVASGDGSVNGVGAKTGGEAVPAPESTYASRNWWWLALAGLGVVVAAGACAQTIRTRRHRG